MIYIYIYIYKDRPIIAGPNSPTQHLSELLEKILYPLVPYLKSYIKDDWDFRKNYHHISIIIAAYIAVIL